MPFHYTAVDASGKTQTGKLDVADQREALERLSALGLTPVSVEEGSDALPWWQREINLTSSPVQGPVLQDFLFQLSYMLRANLALLPTVEMIAERIQNRRMKSILTGALVHLKNGQSLSASLERAEPNLNPQVLIALKLGETSNTLAEAAQQSAENLGDRIQLRNTMISASIYPIILLLMAGVVLWIVLFYLLPILEPLFVGPAASGESNPLTGLLLVRDVVVVLVQGIAVLAIVSLVALPYLRRKGVLNRVLDTLPLIGGLRRDARTQIAAGTVASILHSGGDIDEALGLLVKTAPPGLAKEQMMEVQEKVRDGASFSSALQVATAYNPTLRQMALLGESGEQLPGLMRTTADMLGTGLRKRFEKVVAVIVPCLTVTVGLIVGALVMMTIGSVLSINDLAQ